MGYTETLSEEKKNPDDQTSYITVGYKWGQSVPFGQGGFTSKLLLEKEHWT